jgi:hypothetical protein
MEQTLAALLIHQRAMDKLATMVMNALLAMLVNLAFVLALDHVFAVMASSKLALMSSAIWELLMEQQAHAVQAIASYYPPILFAVLLLVSAIYKKFAMELLQLALLM